MVTISSASSSSWLLGDKLSKYGGQAALNFVSSSSLVPDDNYDDDYNDDYDDDHDDDNDKNGDDAVSGDADVDNDTADHKWHWWWYWLMITIIIWRWCVCVKGVWNLHPRLQ